MAETWNEVTVKEALPAVKVKLPDGRVVECQVGGRRLPFAGVWLPDGGIVEVSWKTVTRVLNEDRAVIV